jgi:hypothetical protein
MKLTESFYLAALPVTGTLIAYLFEFGFAGFHGIPISLIQLNIAQLVGAAALGFLALWVIHIYLSLGIVFLARKKLMIFKFVGLGMLFALLPFIFILGMGNDPKLWALFALCFFLPSLVGLFGALLSKDKSNSFTQRWWNETVSVAKESENPKDKFNLFVDTPQLWFSVLFFSMILSVAAGNRYASIAVSSVVTKSDSSRALVVIYGERWFFRPVSELSQSRVKSKGELHVISGDSTKEITLMFTEKSDSNNKK